MSHAWPAARIAWASLGVLALAAGAVGAYFSLRPPAKNEPPAQNEFVFRARLPDGKAGAVVYFPVVQECEAGIHRWIEIPAEGRSADDYEEPAPGVRLTPVE